MRAVALTVPGAAQTLGPTLEHGTSPSTPLKGPKAEPAYSDCVGAAFFALCPSAHRLGNSPKLNATRDCMKLPSATFSLGSARHAASQVRYEGNGVGAWTSRTHVEAGRLLHVGIKMLDTALRPPFGPPCSNQAFDFRHDDLSGNEGLVLPQGTRCR
jgi:hypothetical protein